MRVGESKLRSQGFKDLPIGSNVGLGFRVLEASKGGTKVGRMKDPLYKDSYLGITPPTFILPFEAPEGLGCVSMFTVRIAG